MPYKTLSTNRKKDGFNGQRAIVLPSKILKVCSEHPLIRNLYITDIGFYPKAKYHFRERNSGVSQHILIYCTDGAGWLRLQNQEIAVNRGDVLIIPSNTAHQYESSEDNPWSIYWMHIKGNSSNDFVQMITQEKTVFCNAVNFSEERIRMFNILYTTLENGYSSDNLGFINMSLWYFLSSFLYPETFLLPYSVTEKDAIDHSIEFMQQNLDMPLTLNELAAEVHISPSHYSALFRKKTGYPPLEYFNHIKIQKACQYLQFTNLQVKEIAYKLGINDPSYFSRFFTNVMGQSPNSYRSRTNNEERNKTE
ncbi:MAG: AraC family transcriptional regulator [Flavitalea sp.]